MIRDRRKQRIAAQKNRAVPSPHGTTRLLESSNPLGKTHGGVLGHSPKAAKPPWAPRQVARSRKQPRDPGPTPNRGTPTWSTSRAKPKSWGLRATPIGPKPRLEQPTKRQCPNYHQPDRCRPKKWEIFTRQNAREWVSKRHSADTPRTHKTHLKGKSPPFAPFPPSHGKWGASASRRCKQNQTRRPEKRWRFNSSVNSNPCQSKILHPERTTGLNRFILEPAARTPASLGSRAPGSSWTPHSTNAVSRCRN